MTTTTQQQAYRGVRRVTLTILITTVAVSVEAANECQVSYVYTSGSGPSAVPQVVQTQVSANATKTINQGAMRYVINDRDWPVDVEVTTLPSGTKWVHLPTKGDRDPANGNFIGNIELKKVKCLPGGTSSGGGTAGQGGGSEPQTVEALAALFFEATMKRAEESKKNSEAVNAMKAEAQSTTRRAADSYPGCPSAQAQAKYDELKEGRRNVVSARGEINAALAQAKTSLTACQQKLANAPLCVAAHAYATAYLTSQQIDATTAILALDEALAVLRSLQCVRPADERPVSLVANP